MTFSIVAIDAETGDIGVAVASKFLAVGSLVPWARRASAGSRPRRWRTCATAPMGWRPGGRPWRRCRRRRSDRRRPWSAERQLGVVDVHGPGRTYTGSGCLPWAGGRTGPGYAAQGNILAGAQSSRRSRARSKRRRSAARPAARGAPRRRPGRGRPTRASVGGPPGRARGGWLQRGRRPLDRPPGRRPRGPGPRAHPAPGGRALADGAARSDRPPRDRRAAGRGATHPAHTAGWGPDASTLSPPGCVRRWPRRRGSARNGLRRRDGC